jgi:hypothetical protein
MPAIFISKNAMSQGLSFANSSSSDGLPNGNISADGRASAIEPVSSFKAAVVYSQYFHHHSSGFTLLLPVIP